MTDPTQRRFTLLSLLEARPVWSGPELAERLGVTSRTVRRDIERLRELGYPVTGEQGAEGGYRLGRGTKLPPLVLDDDEAVAVAAGLRQAAAGGLSGIEEDALRALTKLEQVLPSRLLPTVRAIDVATATLQLPGQSRVDAEVLSELARAASGQLRVRFAYHNVRQERSERHVEPLQLLTTGQVWYLFGFDLDRDDWRTFRLDRVSDLHVTTFRYRPRDHPDPVEHVRSRLSSPRRWAQTAVVRFHAPAAKVRQRIPSYYGSCVEIETQLTEVTAGAEDLDSLARHLALAALDLDAQLDLVTPPELAAALRRVAAKIGAFAEPEKSEQPPPSP